MNSQLFVTSMLGKLFDPSGFLPHGHCFLWEPNALWLRIVSDSLIALSYYSIPIALAYFVYRRRDLAFRWVFVMFGVFILGCGTTHVMDVWTIWTPVYWLDGTIRALTAAASIFTAVLLWPLIPKAMALPSPAQLQTVNARLTAKASAHELAILELERTRGDLERRVQERTADLHRTNEALVRSEERYRSLVEAMTSVVWLSGPEGEFDDRQPSWESYTGQDYEQYRGWGRIEAFHPDDRKVIRECWREALSSCSLCQFEGRLWHRESGEYRYVRVRAVPLRDAEGRVREWIGTVTDIHDRRSTEDKIRQVNEQLEVRVHERTAQLEQVNGQLRIEISERKSAEEKVRGLLESAPDAIVIVANDGRIRMVNAQTEHMFGYRREEMIGQPIEMLVPERHRQGHVAHRQGYERNPHVRPMGLGLELHGRRKDGSEFPTAISLSPVGEGRDLAIFADIRDITGQREIEEKISILNRDLESRNMQLVAINHELEAFSYSVSHDLRAPLRALDGFSRVVSEHYADRLDDRGRDYLQRIRDASQRMGHLIDDLLRLSRISRGEFRCTEVDLSELARQLIADYRSREPERRVEVQIEPQLRVLAEPELMRVALDNLLGNAWKFTGRRDSARIEFGHIDRDGTVAYYVRDNGAGFDMAYASKLFGAFQRLHGREEFEGTGIGLATVQRIVHRHGGHVWAEAEPDRGATFYFTLPASMEA